MFTLPTRMLTVVTIARKYLSDLAMNQWAKVIVDSITVRATSTAGRFDSKELAATLIKVNKGEWSHVCTYPSFPCHNT